MNWDLKTILLAGGLAVLVALGVVTLVRDLRPTNEGVPGPGGLPQPKVSAPTPEDLHPSVTAGQAALQAGNIDEALSLLADVPEEHASYPLALHNLGVAQDHAGDLVAAEESFSELTRVQGENPNVFISLAGVQYRQGKYAEAEHSALRVLELAPGLIETRYDIALYRVAQARLADAVRSYDRAFKIDRQGQLLSYAEEGLRRLQEARPELADTHYALAYFASALGGKAREIDELERYLALDPEGEAAAVASQRLAAARRDLDSQTAQPSQPSNRSNPSNQ